ncbi:TIGR03773 family transporter-associated surface protein [Kribbella sp. NPDC055110]
MHTDVLHTTYDGTSLQLLTRIGTGDVREADPAGLIFNLEDRGAARLEVPDAPAFAFLGTPGSTVWIAPESQDPELIWPGWDTEAIPAGVLKDDVVDLTLVSAEGPGAVEVFFNYDAFSGAVPRLFSSVDPTYRTVHQAVGRHVHANWSFGALGTYKLRFQATATTAAGAPVTSGPVEYTFVVGPYEQPTTPPTSPPTTPPTTPPTSPPTTPPSTPGTPPVTPPSTPTTTPPTTTPTTPTPGNTPTTTPPPTRPTVSPTPAPTRARITPRTTAPTRLPTTASDESHRASPAQSTLRPCITTQSPTGDPTRAGGTTSAGTTASPSTTSSPGATTSAGATGSPGTTVPASTTLTSGHADYAVRIENGALTSRLKDGTKGGDPVWRDPGSVIVRLGSPAGTTVPGGAFSFLGAAGTQIWQIPQTQKDGVVWLGWNTEELNAAQVYGGGVDWRLDKVTGPGRVAVFEFDSFGQPKVIFNSGDGLPDTYRIPLGTHAHGNWAFTKAGTYRVTFTHTATFANGKQSTDTATLTFEVGASGGARSADGSSHFVHRSTILGADSWSNRAQSQTANDAGGCKLAMTGGSVGFWWIGAAAVFAVLGVVLLVASRRSPR